ncbi:hypothetical protein M011DRAFT_463303 [Sporormia fimetaria CBS 119925]|uniref:BTB domain-containing protein n=1 Tax=Sporormia fimetaria CBS 119925 TaxID=1340428 RepID=A0A6A6VMH4_9PLEO|nr:hypothetical protein M011DRAFT_463303 [Sporormia fimetaria CBS 119925]
METQHHWSVRIPSRRYSKSPTVHIVVGTGEFQQEFDIHHDLICSRSKFFKNALSGNWLESAKEIKLPQEDRTTFALYLELLYTDLVPLDEPEDGKSWVQNAYMALSELYVLCEKLIDPTSKRTVFKKLVNLFYSRRSDGRFELPGSETVQILYEGTFEDDQIRAALGLAFATCADAATMEKLFNGYSLPAEFYYDLARGTALQLVEHRSRLRQKALELKIAEAELDQRRDGYFRGSHVNAVL